MTTLAVLPEPYMYKKLAVFAATLVFGLSPLFASASVTSDLQAQIAALLAQIATLQAQLGGSGSGGSSSSSSSCVVITNNLYFGITDARTGGEVSKLQRFLGVNPTGYFGPMTQEAVQNWQSAHSIVSSGSPDTTGYGAVGPSTRAAMGTGCNGTTTYPTTPTYVPSSGPTQAALTITSSLPAQGSVDVQLTLPKQYSGDYVVYSVNPIQTSVSSGSLLGLNYYYNDTNKGVFSAHLGLSQAHEGFANNPGGLHWFTLPSGKYQVFAVVYPSNPFKPGTEMEWLPIGTEPGALKIINGPTFDLVNGTPQTNPTLSITSVTTAISPPMTVVVGYDNMPSTGVSIVNASGQALWTQELTSGGGGSRVLSLQSALPTGYYRAQAFTSNGTVIATSAPYYVSSNVQTNPVQTNSVVINSFTVSPSSVTTGGTVQFNWSSNLTQSDISYYGGGCYIGGLSVNNAELYVTNGFSGASGQTSYAPTATATYTLRCSSGGKDGSPSASRQVTVAVAPAVQAPSAIVAGVYEGTLPPGVHGSYGVHPEGTVNVNVTGDGTSESRTIVLSSYEPINWIISNPTGARIPKIVLIGYYASRVTGDVSGVPVEVHSLNSDGVWGYSYTGGHQDGSNGYELLSQWLSAHYPNQWTFAAYVSSYTGSTMNLYIGFKG